MSRVCKSFMILTYLRCSKRMDWGISDKDKRYSSFTPSWLNDQFLMKQCAKLFAYSERKTKYVNIFERIDKVCKGESDVDCKGSPVSYQRYMENVCFENANSFIQYIQNWSEQGISSAFIIKEHPNAKMCYYILNNDWDSFEKCITSDNDGVSMYFKHATKSITSVDSDARFILYAFKQLNLSATLSAYL